MRVIAGEAKGHVLRAPKGSTTRPTADKIKGAIFSMIESVIMSRVPEGESLWQGCAVLDLYAGSGALGIEALSRGAEWADFVEEATVACKAIQDNLTHTRLASRAKVHCLPVLRSLSAGYRDRLKAPYDIVLMDPPYADPAISQVLAEISQPDLLKPGGMVVVEHSRRVSLEARYGVVDLLKSRRHGDTVISVYVSAERAEED